MQRYLTLLTLLAGTLVQAHAVPLTSDSVSYDFSGTLADHFVPFFGETSQEFVQQGGQLQFHNNNIDIPFDEAEGLVHTSFHPRYDQSWSASVELTVPLSYNNFPGDPPTDPNQDEFIAAGIAAIHSPSGSIDDPLANFFVTLLEVRVNPQVNGLQRSLMVDGSNGLQALVETVLGEVQLDLSFDASVKELTASQNGQFLAMIDIDDSQGIDWNMSPSDTFQFVIVGDSSNEPIDPQNPITFDNFSATLVPEPATLLLAMMGLAGLVQGRRR